MKIQKLIFTFIVLGLSLSSCSKNDDAELVEAIPEYPMKSLIESGAMTLKTTKVNSPNHFELGYKFKSFKNGKITALGIRVPENDEYRVTLWNADTEEVLKTVNIVSTSGLLSFKDIAPINIMSGTTYFISLNTNDYYLFNDDGNIVFPAESENVLIIGYAGVFGVNQVLPQNINQSAYSGMVDIKFIPNN